MGKDKKRVWKEKRLFPIILPFLCILTGCQNDGGDSIYNFGNTEPKNIDPWTYLQDTALSSNKQILGFASSASRLGITIGVIGIVFSILYMAIRILFTRSSKTRNEIKEEIMIKGMTAIMIFSIPLWLGICKLIGELLV